MAFARRAGNMVNRRFFRVACVASLALLGACAGGGSGGGLGGEGGTAGEQNGGATGQGGAGGDGGENNDPVDAPVAGESDAGADTAPLDVAAAPACIPRIKQEPSIGDLVDAGTGTPPAVLVPSGLDQRPATTTCLPLPRPTFLPGDPFPRELRKTGCFQTYDLREAVSGPIPYDLNSPLWSDHATKRRWLVLPAGATIKIGADGDWDFPNGTMLLKSFALGELMVETRFLVRHQDGQWAGYTYKWDEGGANHAILIDQSTEPRTIGQQVWHFPTRKNCLECHTEAAGRSLGLETAQLNRAFLYPNGRRANQIATFTAIGLFEQSPGDPATLPAYPTPARANAGTVAARARSYLHANCSHCHRPGGAFETFFDLRWSTPLEASKTVDRDPIRGRFDLRAPKIISPGVPEQSIILLRMASRVPDVRMPAFGSSEPDHVGLTLVGAWISSLTCPTAAATGQ